MKAAKLRSMKMNDEITSQIIDITPAMATEWLERNPDNRPITDSKVSQYSHDMKNGKWDMNGETIKIAIDGTLLDGQHRLWAIFKTGVTVPIMVVTNLPRSCFATIDTGRPRSGADAISINDSEQGPNARAMAAVAKLLFNYGRNGKLSTKHARPPTNNDLLDTLRDNEGVLESVLFIKQLYEVKRSCSASGSAVTHYLFSKKDRGQANEFFVTLNTGANLDIGDPIHTLRKRLNEIARLDGKKSADKFIPYLIKTWNFCRAGKQSYKLLIEDDFNYKII